MAQTAKAEVEVLKMRSIHAGLPHHCLNFRVLQKQDDHNIVSFDN